MFLIGHKCMTGCNIFNFENYKAICCRCRCQVGVELTVLQVYNIVDIKYRNNFIWLCRAVLMTSTYQSTRSQTLAFFTKHYKQSVLINYLCYLQCMLFQAVDWEVELAIIIGKGGSHIKVVF